MTTTKKIPHSVLDRFAKFRTLAADTTPGEAAANERRVAAAHVKKTEARWPGIRDVVDRVERRERARATREGEIWTPPRPTHEEVEKMFPAALRKVSDLLGLGLVDITESTLDWAIRHIEEAADDYVWAGYKSGDDVEPGGMIMIKELIESEIGLEIEEADDDETGDTLVVFTLEIPVEVWRRIADTKNGPKTLVRHLDTCYLGAGNDDDE